MIFRRLHRSLAMLMALVFIAGCAPVPSNDELNISELVRVAPGDLLLQATMPDGLSETGKAYIRWAMRDPDDTTTSDEIYELRRSGSARTDDGRTQVSYRLSRSDYNRFKNQQIQQRAQLLAGFHYKNFFAGPDFCDVAGVDVRRGHVYVSLQNTGAGISIAGKRLPKSAAEIAREAPFCI